ncbi:MAG TPA: corrinoid protein [Dehalococcoidales bacterium]|nr:corrinoid protein [Dehalococcoidales bacterium]
MSKEELMGKLAKTIIDGDEQAAGAVAQEIIAAGIDPLEAISQGGRKGLDIVGERFQRLEAFLPELVQAGDAMKACMAVLKPHINQQQTTEISQGGVVIGTVKGDIHTIGKDLVATMLIASGFEVHDLGINVPVKRFIEESEKVQAKVIALSALLTQTSYYQKQVIDYLRDAGMRNRYYVVVGGAPISPEWATEAGADGYARTAVGATQLVKRLLTEGVLPPLSQPVIINQ